jgi:hypothetical protein
MVGLSVGGTDCQHDHIALKNPSEFLCEGVYEQFRRSALSYTGGETPVVHSYTCPYTPVGVVAALAISGGCTLQIICGV